MTEVDAKTVNIGIITFVIGKRMRKSGRQIHRLGGKRGLIRKQLGVCVKGSRVDDNFCIMYHCITDRFFVLQDAVLVVQGILFHDGIYTEQTENKGDKRKKKHYQIGKIKKFVLLDKTEKIMVAGWKHGIKLL